MRSLLLLALATALAAPLAAAHHTHAVATFAGEVSWSYAPVRGDPVTLEPATGAPTPATLTIILRHWFGPACSPDCYDWDLESPDGRVECRSLSSGTSDLKGTQFIYVPKVAEQATFRSGHQGECRARATDAGGYVVSVESTATRATDPAGAFDERVAYVAAAGTFT